MKKSELKRIIIETLNEADDTWRQKMFQKAIEKGDPRALRIKAMREKEKRVASREKTALKKYGVEVIEVDQSHAAVINSGNYQYDGLSLDKIQGGDTAAIKAISGGHLIKRRVMVSEEPNSGYVWFVKGKDGNATEWKSSYDTSG